MIFYHKIPYISMIYVFLLHILDFCSLLKCMHLCVFIYMLTYKWYLSNMTHMKLDSSHLDHEPKLVHLIHALAAQEPAVWSDTHIWIFVHMYHKICKKANSVLVEIRTWGLLGRLTLIQEQRRPQPAGEGGWPLSFWQNVRDRGQVLDGVVQSSYNLPYLSDRAMWTSSIDAKYKKEMSELKLSLKIHFWQSIEFRMNSMKLLFFFEMIDSCLIELRKRNPLRRTTFKLFRTFKWAVANSHSLHWRGVVSLAKFS